MQDTFIINRKVIGQIINELKQIDLCRYDDYVRMVGIVTMLEAILKRPNETPSEEVTTDG